MPTEGGKLPPVLPIVLYKGQSRWPAPLSIEEMIAPAPEALARYLPRMSYFFIDEQRTPVTLTTEERNTVARLKLSSDREKAAARADGQRSLLVSILEHKFGQLDEVSAARVAKAKPAQLAKWALRVMAAKSLDEVWA